MNVEMSWRSVLFGALLGWLAVEAVDLVFTAHRAFVIYDIHRLQKWESLREQARREQREAARNDRVQ